MPYLIDGHNVVAALPDLELDDPDDEAKLVLKLRSWAGRTGRKAVVVFDGGLPGGLSRTLSGGGLKVIFAARKHSTADRIIQARLRRMRDAGNWTVVSSDREVLASAHAAGARVLTSQEFVGEMAPPRRVEPEKPQAPSSEEVEAWLEVFGEAEAEPPPPQQGRLSQQRARSTRTIADQLGMPTPPPPRKKRPSPRRGEKPEEVTEEEVEEWLDVFGEAEATAPPPPEPRRRRRGKSDEVPLEVRKEHPEALSPEEVERWQGIFPETPRPEREKGKRKKPKAAGRSRKRPKRKRYEHAFDEEKDRERKESGLSPEDLEQWYRLFGEEPDV